MISTPDGERPIESIAAGDVVLSYDPATEGLVARTVTETCRHAASEGHRLLRLKVRGGTFIDVTPEHLLYVTGAWRPAGKCGPGTVLRSWDGERWNDAPVVSIVALPGMYDVFNLHVEAGDDFDQHNYLAAGLVVHNLKSIDFAAGGIVTRPTRALIGEGREPEGVFPLSRAREFGFGGGPNGGQGGVTVHIHLSGGVYAQPGAIRELAQEVAQQFTRTLRTYGSFSLNSV